MNLICTCDLCSWEQVPQNRLSWPALLEHPFVKETPAEIEVSSNFLCEKFRFYSFGLCFLFLNSSNFLFDLQYLPGVMCCDNSIS